MAMRFCLHFGCRLRQAGPYCDEHKRQRERDRRGSSTERGYDWRWRTRATAFLAQYPLCGMRPDGRHPVMSRCFDERRVTAAVQVDHVEPHRGNDALFWDEDRNWQALCRECGARKSQAGL
jgi:5-methylcytosine-specific restriction protein A